MWFVWSDISSSVTPMKINWPSRPRPRCLSCNRFTTLPFLASGWARAAPGCCSSVWLFFLTLLLLFAFNVGRTVNWWEGGEEETKEFFFFFLGRTFCLPCLPRETDDWRVEVGMEMSECVDVRLLPLRHANNPIQNARWAMVDSSHLLSPPFPVGPNDLPLARSFSSIVSHNWQGNSRYYVAILKDTYHQTQLESLITRNAI